MEDKISNAFDKFAKVADEVAFHEHDDDDVNANSLINRRTS